MIKYEEKKCNMCGKIFTPYRKDQVTCGDPVCVQANRRLNNRARYRENPEKFRERNRRYMQKIRERQPKKDTIVAIGYAERQREQTLKMVGKIKVEL